MKIAVNGKSVELSPAWRDWESLADYNQVVRLAGENPHHAPSVRYDLGQGSEVLLRGDLIYLKEGMTIEVVMPDQRDEIQELESLRARLKCGEYDGADLLEARVAIERLITLLKKVPEERALLLQITEHQRELMQALEEHAK